MEETFGGDSGSFGIYQLGIGPYIDASWTLSLILLLKFPREIYSHLQQLRRNGREVSSSWPTKGPNAVCEDLLSGS